MKSFEYLDPERLKEARRRLQLYDDLWDFVKYDAAYYKRLVKEMKEEDEHIWPFFMAARRAIREKNEGF